MTALADAKLQDDTQWAGRAIRRILLVDDSRAQLKIISSILRRWNYEVVEATSGEAAIEVAKSASVDLVISDWMMPNMNGLELRRELQRVFDDRFVYFILLTSRSDKSDLAEALEDGADDFVSKPLNIDELHARISVAERLTRLQRDLAQKNALIEETLDELKAVYSSLDRDLEEARHLQQSLVRERQLEFGPAQVSLLLEPSGQVGGDLVGAFRISESRIGCYAVDVSGHGIASAMIAARLSGYLSGNTPDTNIALEVGPDGIQMRPLPAICHHLNELAFRDMGSDMYFTLVLLHYNLETGRARMVQAGHPHPMLIRANGDVELYGSGGNPVGLVDAPTFEEFEVQLEPGDRLMLHSDGFTEDNSSATDIDGVEWLAHTAAATMDMRGVAFLDALHEAAMLHSGRRELRDDLSAVLLEV